MPNRLANRGWLLAAVILTLLKFWHTEAQTIFAIGPAFHDDRLFADLAAHLINGDWLGPYNQFTLAKGPMFPLFIAAVFWVGLPLMLAQQLLYAAACATVTRALTPWLRPGAAQFALYSVLLWNPMSYDAGNLSRLMRQNLGTPLALFTVAGLIVLFHRRRESARRRILPAVLTGLALGIFWLTREEGVWFLPAVGLLLLALPASFGRNFIAHWRPTALTLAVFIGSALLPLLAVSSLNLRHYGWFGTVEFHATEFKDAYGALTRIRVGPELPQVPVTRQMREAAYAVSPAFARLQPHLEGPVGDHWSEKDLFPAAERQLRGGWFVWALRDAVHAAGLDPDAGAAMRYYRQVADEINAACAAGAVPALPPRSGFAPPLNRGLVQPLVNHAYTYIGFFLSFDGFTPYSPDSIGDYAELKPFRNVVGTRLSHAPRSLEPVSPEQQQLEAAKLARLDRIGTIFSRIITWLGPLLLLVGAVRALESAADRRLSFPLGLAGALLAACAAYLAINILVQVTSFYNMSPAALASAYPLYLLALAAIVIDARHGWRKPAVAPVPVAPAATPAPALSVAPQPYRWLWLWLWLAPIGMAVVVFAARLAEIRLFGSDVPYNDQWYIEASQILAPWLNGTLQLRDFFIPHFEHVPVWTRLLAWLQVVLTGRWDPLVQMTVNATLHATFIWLVARWAYRSLPPLSAHLTAAVLVLGGALPHAWENIAWGFQSQFPLALIFLFLHVHGACTHAPGTKGWWLAQSAALAALFTLASMWLAPLAVVASWWWTGPRRWRTHAVPLVIAALGVGTLILIRVHLAQDGAFAQIIRSPLGFLHASFHLLGWPSLLPGAVAIIQLPWVIHALRLRHQPATAPVDRIILVLGLVNCTQALALAFARTGDTNDFVSRYGDLFFLGVLSGALALPRLIPAAGRMRPVFFALSVLWTGLVTTGLVHNSTQGHAHFFHLHAAQNADFRRAAVQAYLASGNRELLDSSTARWTLCQEPDLVCRLLDQPSFRALLPASVNPLAPADAAGTFVRGLLARWSWLLAAGTVLFAVGAVLITRRPAVAPLVSLPVPAEPWRFRLAAAATLSALALMLAWSDPFSFNRERRWQRLLGGADAVKNLTFAFAGPSPFGPERLQGAAPIRPEVLRNQFFGTAPEGPGYTGTVISSPFRISTPWLIVPYAGYPVGHGNGLRLRLLDRQGGDTAEELGCPGPNLDGISYWVVDVRNQQDRQARLVLYDGRTDTEAWVAAAPPIATGDASLAETLAAGLKNEAHASTHVTLGLIAFVACLCAVFSWPTRRRR
jgi:hypothetical protein